MKNWIFAARKLTFNKQYLHSSHQIYDEKYYYKSDAEIQIYSQSLKHLTFLIKSSDLIFLLIRVFPIYNKFYIQSQSFYVIWKILSNSGKIET